LKLNLGCGLDKRQGYVNIDCRPECNPDLLHDLTKPLPYSDNSVDEIIAKDLLEHFSHHDVERILQDWYRVLKPGGKIYIQTPDMCTIALKILNGELWSWKQISYWVYGGQEYPQNYHKSGFTSPTLTALLHKIGFKVEKANKGGTNLMIWAVKP